MGLGFELDFLPRPHGLLRRRAGLDELARMLRTEATRLWPVLGGWARVETVDATREVHLLPCEEPVRLEAAGKAVRFSARTSTTGPGYHAFLVTLLDRVAAQDGGAWHDQAAGEDSETLDETGYFEERDFGRLQQSMCGWLASLAQQLSSNDQIASARICMPLHLPDPGEPALLTPGGLRPVAYLRELTALEGEGFERAAAAWFAWWGEGTAAATAGVARSLLFELPWRIPDSDGERAEIALALALLESLPAEQRIEGDRAADLQQELRALLAPDARDAVPRPHGFGYRRGTVRFNPFSRCEVRLPGYWHERSEEEGTVALYWHGDRSLRISQHTVTEADAPRSAASILEWAHSRQPADALRSAVWPAEGGGGLGWIERASDPEPHFALSAFHALDGVLAHATIAYASEADHAWAEETAAGIRLR